MSDSKSREREAAKAIVRHYFKDDYERPFELTDGQADIFNEVFLRRHPRSQTIACTRYGKSTVVALGLILRTLTKKETFAIVAGRKEKAQIIMEKVIQHLFDYRGFIEELDLAPDEPLDRLRRERSKDRINWRRGGGLRTFSAGIANQKAVIDSLTGFGSANIVEDESALVPDNFQAMVMRMLGGHKESFLMKVGNPFTTGHFKKTWEGGRYHRIYINYRQALAEGRYTPEFIEEVRDEPFFDELYECKFPKETEIIGGYRKLLHNIYFDNAEIDEMPEIVKEKYIDESDEGKEKEQDESPVLGVDIAEGGAAQSVYVLRYPKSNFARVLEKNNESDLMVQVQKVIKYKQEFGIRDYYIAIDDVGVGAGVSDALAEKDILITPVKEGEQADDSQRYANKKAELNWEAGKWIKNGGKLVRDEGFREGENIYYKENASSKLQMEPKADLMKRGVASPDTWDAFCLTFINRAKIIEADDIGIM